MGEGHGVGGSADGLWGWGRGTTGSQGCLAVHLGQRSPGTGRVCWHLVSAKRVCRLECRTSEGTGIEQRARGPCVPEQEMGASRDASRITHTLCCLLWCWGLSMANSRLESMSSKQGA